MMTGYESKASEAAPHSPKHAPPSPVYASDSPEHAPPSDDNLEPTEDQALPAPISHAPLSPYYSTYSEHIEDDLQEVDPEDVPEEDPFEDEDEEVKELLALAASTLVVPDPTLPSEEETEPFEEDEIGESSEAVAARLRGSTLAQGNVDRLVVILEETDERVADLGTRYKQDSHEIAGTRILHTKTVTAEQEAAYARDALSFAMDMIKALKYKIQESDDRLTGLESTSER
ncbi:hypothetical protein Tco_1391909 [Tanacetum coccineum]